MVYSLRTNSILLCLVLALVSCSRSAPLEMTFTTPAETWLEALPIGNGRLGAMVWGGISEERIGVNESTMWSGQEDSLYNPVFGRERLDSLRALFFDGKTAEGNGIAWNALTGNERAFGSHVPLGDLLLQFPSEQSPAEHYTRSLDIRHGIVTTEYDQGGVHFTRRTICSHVDSVLIIDLQANHQHALTFTLAWQLLRPEAVVSVENTDLVVRGQATQPSRVLGGVDFECRTRAVADQGSMESGVDSLGNATLRICNASHVTLYIDLRTSFVTKDYAARCLQTIDKAAQGTVRRQFVQHSADVAKLMDRVSVQLGEDKKQELFFQYARYLTIAASREDSPLPIALQAMWNDNLACNMGWNNDYHLDINTQQNYWLTGVGNLSECDMPLMRYIGMVAKWGERTAQQTYGCSGWTAHTTANVWGFTAPSACIAWGLFPTAGSWLATHLWSHYGYTGDTIWLREQGYPLLKDNARFLLDYMTTDPATGYLVSGPSISPENAFLDAHGHRCCAAIMPTVDRVLAYEVFHDCILASRLLHTDSAFADSLHTALTSLPPLQANYYGGLREWLDDYQEAEPHHRHTSHLLALFPYHQITLQRTPDLATAAAHTIEHRLSAPGWEDVEWSRANAVCFHARLGKGDEAYRHLNALIDCLCGKNLLTFSPIGIAGAQQAIYAFDGNTAGAAGMAQMLLQYLPKTMDNPQETVLLLPALPKAWNTGSFKGLCVPGLEMEANWQNGHLIQATAKCRQSGTYIFVLPNGTQITRSMQCGNRLVFWSCSFATIISVLHHSPQQWIIRILVILVLMIIAAFFGIHNIRRNRKKVNAQLEDHTAELARTKVEQSLDKQFVQRMQRYIEDHLSDSNITVENLQQALGVSRTQLFRKTKELLGTSPVELIRHIRLHKAQQLLQNTDMTIQEVAYSVGFTSPSYFSKCYREKFGCSPSSKS